ncbi:oxidoreductase [Nostoc sp. 3335mG]|nr:oxidoreductase [Nostoc sp. 3335mG]
MTDHPRIRVGIIGLSAKRGWAAEGHLAALRALGDRYELVALSASSAESAAMAGEKYGISRCYGTAEELVNDPQVDLVTIAVKVPTHHALVRTALDAGKKVYCEWPLARDAAEAAEMANWTQEKRQLAVVGLQTRAAPAIRYARDLVRDGYVGKVLSTTMVASAGAWADVTDEASAYLNEIGNGATMLSIPFGHAVDALNYVLGEWAEAKAVMGVRRPEVKIMPSGATMEKTAPDQIVVSGTLEGGAVACLHYRGGMSRSTNFLWEINGTDGDLVFTAPVGHPQSMPLMLRGAQGADALAELEVPARYSVAPDVPPGRPFNLAQAYAQLADDIRSGEATVPDFALATRRHVFLDAMLASANFPQA